MKILSEDKFAELILENQNAMYRLAMGILKNNADAEDAVSSSIINAFEHLHCLKKPEKFKSWIMTIFLNESKAILRRNKRIDLYSDTDIFEKKNHEDDTDIWQLVLSLDANFSKVVILYYYEGFSTKEISKILHISEGPFKSRLSRARDKLKIILQ